jgi:hypothetical protein
MAQPQPLELYRVKEVGGGLGMYIDQTVIFSAAPGGADTEGGRWIVERVKTESNWCGRRSASGACEAIGSQIHDWIDSRSCPNARAALEALPDIPVPSFKRRDSLYMTVSDTPLLTIEGTPEQAQSTAQHLLISEFTGPHRIWWETTEKALSACWQREAPRIEGLAVVARLDAAT